MGKNYKKRRRDTSDKAIKYKGKASESETKIGLILSGGGARAAYQAGALKALIPYFKKRNTKISIITGSSIGAINGLLLAASLNDGIESSINDIEELWRERTYKNTFAGSPSGAFIRAVSLALTQYLAPGPNPTNQSIFDPTPLKNRVDEVINSKGGLTPENRAASLESVAVMTAVEGEQRKPLLFLSSHKEMDEQSLTGASFEVCYVDTLSSKHGFASAALPSVLPPVELDTEEGKIRLVDGGIAQNVPVDPAVRLGADKVVVIDVSGRDWWLTRDNESLDTRPHWEIPAGMSTYCLRPPETFSIRCMKPLGPILKDLVKDSKREFIKAVGPTWPIFALLKNKFGEDVAYEAMTYVALYPPFINRLIERGYNETLMLLRNREEPEFHRPESLQEFVDEVSG